MTTADTKIDLLVNPMGWLARALQLWSPTSNFGEVQNQAYGYLWPMGSFFAAGDFLGMPAWVVQRLWWALLLCVAYTGIVALAGWLNIGTPTARILAGVAFALSPRILTELGVVSGEAWPTAIAPWVLVPLIGLANGAPMRRSIALSALAVACAGGINATAVFATVPLALLWLAMLRPGRRVVAIVAWCFAVACATVWWLVPLLLLSKYSPPFLDYIETAAITTWPTDLTTVLRGTSHWLAYLGGPHGPLMTAGNRIVHEPVLFAATIAVAALAVAGLVRRGMPHRRFLITGLLLGVALLTLGHMSSLDTGLTGPARQFLDSAGAPLRNVHKFDVLIRLPLALGLAHLLGIFVRAAALSGRGWHLARRRAVIVTAAAMAAIAGVAAPGLAGGLVPAGSFNEVPGYWRDAAAWLNSNLDRDRVLVVPSARFPHYVWGSTADEITQALLDHNWGVRNAIPLAPANTIRLLDSIDQALTSGTGSAGLAPLLARSGVKYLLLRSDLHYGKTGTARPIQVRQALARSPGISLVQTFGPEIGGGPVFGEYYDYGFHKPTQALEIYEVDGTPDVAGIYDASLVETVVGGPESLLEMAAAGQLPAAPTVLSGDLGSRKPPGPVTITDGLRRREVSFGRSQDSTSATLAADEQWHLQAASHDYLPTWGPQAQTVAKYSGISGISASSSWSQPYGITGARPGHLPFAAMDGDPETSWRAPPEVPAANQWLEVELPGLTSVSEVTLTFDRSADSYPAKVMVIADTEGVLSVVDLFAAKHTVKLGGVYGTRTIRIVITEVFGTSRTGQGAVGISEIEIPGVVATRSLKVPAGPASGQPADVVLAAARAGYSCFFADGATRCNPALARGSEDGGRIDRTVTLPAKGSYLPTIWARPEPGPELDKLVEGELAPAVVASTRGIKDPAARPGAILDGDPSTAWYADSGDGNTWLRINWLAPRKITGLQLTLDPAVAGTRPDAITVTSPDGTRGGILDENGTLLFDRPLETSEIMIFLLDRLVPSRSQDPYTNTWQKLPTAVGEVTVLPDPKRAPSNLERKVDLPCGSGPLLDVGGNKINTRISATVRDLLELREVPAMPCLPAGRETVDLGPGDIRIVATSSPVVSPVRILLKTRGSEGQVTPGPLEVTSWSADKRELKVSNAGHERVLVVRENTNPGWQATLGGRALEPIVLDGWQQGWRIPPGLSGTVTLTFQPNSVFHIALAAGGVLMVGLIVAAILPSRRLGAHEWPRRRRPTRSGRLLAVVLGAAGIAVAGGLWSGLIVAVVVAAFFTRRWLLPQLSSVDRRRARLTAAWLWNLLAPLLVTMAGVASWLAADRHRDVLPQSLALMAVILLWLSTVARPWPAGLMRTVHKLQRPFDEVVAGRTERQAGAEDQSQGAQEVPGKRLPPAGPVDPREYEWVP